MIPSSRFTLRRAFALAAFLTFAASAVHAQQPAAHTVRIGYQKAGLLAVLKAQGSLERALSPLGYDVKWFEFPAGPQLLEALNANSIDFGYTGAPPPVFAQAAGIRFVYVGAEPGGRHNEALIVKPDSPVRTLADLRGKRIALQKGSSSNYLLLELVSKAGLRYEDIHPVYLAPADARAAFESGSVDAWVIWDPYYAAAQQALHARTVADYTSLDTAFNFYEATRDFAQQQPAAVNAILAQLRTTGLWVNAHPAETAALLAPKVGLDAALVETWVRRVPYGATTVDDEVIRSQQSVADAFYGAKLIPQKLVVRDVVWHDAENGAKVAGK
ncbi:sulfonate ABC transporter substrate-binding protein [Paraburkholderia caballeronis]|uniref:sulfonate ABC transporter substrate-binding protein n=1 Tax=Paraburkholderia caballeronis TaxID=416943 RepID=UPI00106674A9|nr:sulfonate ABC transporter substrate-binding protein [Paraburkholderia caballeronis]TDV07850.1 sulfonate transport system substrate-binding protein [Paraburkholderia caballeronis]TDV11213.1 sulfonate transport system substrate-binding protein [Paraburkholderia caballeronis]TDV21593.1 sulfonate transport system substrate-binding protein [Paraburkholderia caballeronis]